MLKYLYITLFYMFMISCHSTKGVDKSKVYIHKNNTLINFIQSSELVKVLDFAKDERKPVFLYLHTSWCMPCRFMEEEVFSYKSTADHMNMNFVNYEVDLEKVNGPDLSIIYETKTIPTLLMLDSKGNEIARYEGSIGNTKLIEWSSNVLVNYSL